MNETDSSAEPPPCKDAARQKLQGSLTNMLVLLTPCEEAFLKALLIDRAPHYDGDHATQMNLAAERLNDDMLFRTPFATPELLRSAQPPKCRRGQSNLIGLWRAFEEGVRPKLLVRQHHESHLSDKKQRFGATEADDTAAASSPIADTESVKSDEEVRADASQYQEDLQYESWDEDEEPPEHYDAWKVLKDEYAKDFGFDYSQTLLTTEDVESDDHGNNFRILGTSADDSSAYPHVLSPPLMDALMNFFPDSVSNQNYWLKYSLVRDGASFETFKQYVRGATHTILAIETTSGEVFGSFTSSPWRTQPGYYGTGESFLWKMRRSRISKVYSLFDQAQMETEIDVHPFSGLNELVQLCTSDKIAVGGGGLDPTGNGEHETNVDVASHTGFGLCINDDFLNGTSAPCATFRNPCLIGHSSNIETFQVVNIECWGLTPCFDEDSAQKLEMTKFFVHESSTKSLTNISSMAGVQHGLSSRDLSQPDFYRRVGSNDRSEEGRDRWQYAALMGTQGLR
jgi:hypothetical protein